MKLLSFLFLCLSVPALAELMAESKLIPQEDKAAPLITAPEAPASKGLDSVAVSSSWVIPRSVNRGFQLGPEERTKPIVVGDILYFASRAGVVHAVHRTDGYTIWKTELPSKGPVDGAFQYGRSQIYVGDTLGNLYALRSRDGSIAWTFKIQSEWLSPPVVLRDRVIAASSAESVYALSEKDGTEKWHYSRKGDEKMTVRGAPTPTIFGSDVFLGFADGYVAALSVSDGKLLWTKRLRSRDRFYDIDMAPAVDADGVFAATFDGNLYKLDRTTGDIGWVLQLGSYGGFLIEGGKIYFSAMNGFVYSVDKATGTVAWRTEFGKGVGLAPVRSGEHLIVTTSGDPVLVLNPDNGKIVARQDLGAGTLASATGHPEAWFYCLSNYGNLFAFKILNQVPQPAIPETLKSPTAIQRFG